MVSGPQEQHIQKRRKRPWGSAASCKKPGNEVYQEQGGNQLAKQNVPLADFHLGERGALTLAERPCCVLPPSQRLLPSPSQDLQGRISCAMRSQAVVA